MIRTNLRRSRVRENRMLGSVGAKLNGLATRPTPIGCCRVETLETAVTSRSLVIQPNSTRVSLSAHG